MAYTALYRKFRPNSFQEVKGQDHIVTTLKNQLSYDRIGHAYLFCGTRGTGKTTIAKLFAKAVNCEHPVDGNPCDECPSCIAIKAQASMNVIEIDAASNNGVDNIREIIDEVRYSPTEGKYKVYIIDEVHMLSAGAFNSLLTTLSEPPSYVIFILATSEVHKIPVTILSRCQRYDFHRISVDDIVLRINELITAEGIDAEDKAIRYIARSADGALRDALSLLDQCMAFYLGERLTYDKVLEVLGTADYETFATLLRQIRAGSVDECIHILDNIVLSGRDLSQFTVDFTWYLRDLLLAKSADCPEDILEASTEQIESMKHEAQVFDTNLIIRYIKMLSELSNQIKYASQKRILIEVALVKLCRPETERDDNAVLDRLRRLEEALSNGAVRIVQDAAEASNGVTDSENKKETEEAIQVYEKAVSDDLKAIAVRWRDIVSKVSQRMRMILLNAVPTPGNDNHLVIVLSDKTDYQTLKDDNRKRELEEIIMKAVGKKVIIEVQLHEGTPASLKKIPDLSKMFKGKDIEIEILDD